jgi:enoyl-CoA hydratase/carnithine racemase
VAAQPAEEPGAERHVVGSLAEQAQEARPRSGLEVESPGRLVASRHVARIASFVEPNPSETIGIGGAPVNAEHCLAEREGPVVTVILNAPGAGRALEEARTLAATICHNGPLSIRAPLRISCGSDESDDESEARVKELEIGGLVFPSKDAGEGPRAFAEKRKPVSQGE